jgi:hypothetical protein
LLIKSVKKKHEQEREVRLKKYIFLFKKLKKNYEYLFNHYKIKLKKNEPVCYTNFLNILFNILLSFFNANHFGWEKNKKSREET